MLDVVALNDTSPVCKVLFNKNSDILFTCNYETEMNCVSDNNLRQNVYILYLNYKYNRKIKQNRPLLYCKIHYNSSSALMLLGGRQEGHNGCK